MKRPATADLFGPIIREGDSIVPPRIQEPPRVRNEDPSTSRVAAAAIAFRVQPLQKRILECLAKSRNGLTTREIEAASGIEFATVTPRMRPLADAGMILQTDQRRVSPQRRGTGFVWIITARGVAATRGE